MHSVEKILNNTTPYGKIRASHEGSLHSSTLTGANNDSFKLAANQIHEILKDYFIKV